MEVKQEWWSWDAYLVGIGMAWRSAVDWWEYWEYWRGELRNAGCIMRHWGCQASPVSQASTASSWQRPGWVILWTKTGDLPLTVTPLDLTDARMLIYCPREAWCTRKGIGAMARFHNFSLIFDKIYLVHGQICPVLWLNIIIAIAKALVATPVFMPRKAIFKFILSSSVSI